MMMGLNTALTDSICIRIYEEDETHTPDVSHRSKLTYQESPEPQLIITCDACPYCSDVCGKNDCGSCLLKKSFPIKHDKKKRFLSLEETFQSQIICCDNEKLYYTMCEVRRHNHMNSAWLRAGDNIYDVTKYIKYHPAGSECILQKAGGTSDCTQDISFHSNRAKSIWRDCRIGKLKRCPGERLDDGKSVCVIS